MIHLQESRLRAQAANKVVLEKEKDNDTVDEEAKSLEQVIHTKRDRELEYILQLSIPMMSVRITGGTGTSLTSKSSHLLDDVPLDTWLSFEDVGFNVDL